MDQSPVNVVLRETQGAASAVVGLLGPVGICQRDGLVAVRGGKQQVLLSTLALSAGQPVPGDRLLDALWGDSPPPTADAALRVHVARLRGLLAAARPPAPEVVHGATGYALAVEPERIDSVQWQSLLSSAIGADPRVAVARLEAALSLWRGEPFGGLSDPDLLRIESERLREMRAVALEDRLEVRLRLGEHHAVVSELEALVQGNPLRERRSRLLMVALYRCGRQGDALRTYQDLRRVLADELGLSPSPELQATERALLAQDASLDPPAPARVMSTTVVSPPAELPWWLATARDTAIHGREELLDMLLGAVERVGVEAGGSPRVSVVLLRGDAGVGKTRVLAELARRVGDRGVRVLAGWCDPDGVVPFRPLWEALRDVVVEEGPRARPSAWSGTAFFAGQPFEEGAGASQQTDPETNRLRLFEAMADLLHAAADRRPLLLAIDDLHWLDPASAALLRYLLRQPAPQPVVVVGCYRDDPAEHTAAWTRSLDELRRQHDCVLVDVTELDRDASISLVTDLMAEIGTGDALAVAEKVLPVTGGNPLFLREVVTQLVLASGAEVGADEVPVPPTLLAAVADRVRALDTTARAVVNAAAVLGRQFSLTDVATVACCSTEAVLSALDAARATRLVDEVPGLVDHFAFRHALLREAVHDLMPGSRKARLHLAAGAACAGRDGVEPLLARAFHLLEAVPVCPAEQAAQAATDAADAALGQWAFEEAVRVLDRALALAGPGTDVSDETRFELLVRLGRARACRGEDALRDDAFAAAADVARTALDPARLAVAALGDDLDTRALTPSRARLDLLDEALLALGQEESALRVAVASTFVALASLSSGASRVRGLADETVGIARKVGDPRALSTALLAWTTCTNTTVDPGERLSVVSEALALAEAAGLSNRAARARLTRVGALLRLGRAHDAVAEFARYRALTESSRVPRHLWHADVVAAALSRLSGRFDEAQVSAERALATGQRFGIAEARMAFGVHTFFLHLHRARLAELRPALEAFASARPDLLLWTLSSGLAAHAAGDREAPSRALIDYVERLPGLDPDGEFWSDELVVAAQLASHLDAPRAVADALSTRLTLCRGQFEVFGASSGTFGPVDRALGLLAALRGQHGQACELLRGAFELCCAMDARPWMVWTGTDLAHELRSTGSGREAARLLAIVVPIAHELGMSPVQHERVAGGRRGD